MTNWKEPLVICGELILYCYGPGERGLEMAGEQLDSLVRDHFDVDRDSLRVSVGRVRIIIEKLTSDTKRNEVKSRKHGNIGGDLWR